MTTRLCRVSEILFFIAFGIVAFGVSVTVLSLVLPNEWVGCKTDDECHVARVECLFVIGSLALCFIIIGGITGLIVEIKNMLDPEFQAAKLAAKAQRDRDERIREKAREILMSSTGLPTNTLYAFIKYDIIPQEFIDFATAQFENISP